MCAMAERIAVDRGFLLNRKVNFSPVHNSKIVGLKNENMNDTNTNL